MRSSVLAALIAPALLAQSEPMLWRNRSDQPWSAGPVAFDSARGRLVMAVTRLVLDAARPVPVETWEWDGSRWYLRPTVAGPLPGSPLVYDGSRHCVVQFGGGYSRAWPNPPIVEDATWEFDGVHWQRRSPATAPPARWDQAMTYDRRRHRVLMFGGLGTGGTYLADTWEWDGSNWTQRAATSSPSGRSGAAIAYDPVRRRALLFGGGNAIAHLADTWEWDGVTWVQRAPVLSPPARTNPGMFFEPNASRIVLSGGHVNGSPSELYDRWEWDGTTWRRSYAAAATPLVGSITFDPVRGEEILVGGALGLTIPQLGVYRGGATGKYLEIAAAPRVPERMGHAMAHDIARGRTVLFGGGSLFDPVRRQDTWEWDGQGWTQRSPAVSPPARADHAMAFDLSRLRTVLFGGSASSTVLLGDTWEWDGNAWLQIAVPGPSARSGPAMAFDAVRGVTMMFGGQGNLGVLDDLWEWNGTAWLLRAVNAGPAPRERAAICCDFLRGGMVLHGGFTGNGSTLLTDTWIWNGSVWQQAHPTHSPYVGPLVYDLARARIVHVGPPVMTWDGFDWQEVSAGDGPFYPESAAAAYDAQRNRTVLFGGMIHVIDAYDRYGDRADTWELGPLGVDVGPGCRGSNAIAPRLSIAAPPRLGGGYRATLDGLLPTATFAVVIAGASDTTSPVGPLPIDLTSLGMPGCMLAVSPDQFTVVAAQAGHADYIVPVPDAPALVGLTTSDQAACPDPAANALGVTLSNAVRATVEW